MNECRICNEAMQYVFTATVLEKHAVRYFQCTACGYLCCETPHWLDEAYADPIIKTDTGILRRNVNTADRLTCLLYFGLGERGRSPWLDHAGGLGILTRLMRDRGFEFRWQDKYAENLFARGFEHVDGTRYRGVTAMEVFEHIVDPGAFTEDVLRESGAEILIFSTVVYDGPQPPPLDWWYYSFHGGQHISFFQRRTLKILADRLGLHYRGAGDLHCFSRRPLRRIPMKLLTGPLRLGLIYLAMPGLASKTMPDHQLMASTGG